MGFHSSDVHPAALGRARTMANYSRCRQVQKFFVIGVFTLLWILILVGTIVCHVGIVRIHGSVRDIPTTFVSAYEHVLGLSSIASDALSMQIASTRALERCGVFPSDCFDLKHSSASVESAAEQAIIKRSFRHSLENIRMMATEHDASRDLKSLGFSLNLILEEMKSLDAQHMSCDRSNKAFCRIHTASGIVTTIAPTVCAEFERGLSNPSMIQRWQGNWGIFHLLHIPPVIPVLCMLIVSFFCRRKFRGGTWCCGSRILEGIIWILHLMLWLLSFIISSTVVGGSLLLRSLTENAIIHDVFKDEPSVGALLSHIRAMDPELFAILCEAQFEGLYTLVVGFLLILIFCTIVPFFDVVLFVFRVHKDDKVLETPLAKPAQKTETGPGADEGVMEIVPYSRRSRSKNGYATVVVL